MGVCQASAAWGAVLQLFSSMWQYRTQPSLIVYNAAVGAYTSGSLAQRALQLMLELGCARVAADAATCNAAVASCSGACWPQSLWLLRNMQRSRLEPGIVAFDAVLAGCSDAGFTSSAPDLLRDLEQQVEHLLPVVAREPPVSGDTERKGDLAVLAAERLLASGGLATGTFSALRRALLVPLVPQLQSLSQSNTEAPSPRLLRLAEPALERQAGLGAALASEALRRGASAAVALPPWMVAARRALRGRADGAAAAGAGANRVGAWLASSAAGGGGMASTSCQGRPVGYSTGLWRADKLRPVFVEHDRGAHAERAALLSLLEVLK